MDVLPEQFSSCPVFAALSRKERETLFHQAACRTYHKGDYLAHLGDIWSCFFVVAEGRVLAVKESMEARSLVVTTFGPGEIFWGLAFFHPEAPMIVNLQADERTKVYLWQFEQVQPYLLQNGAAAWQLCQLMVTRMLRASQILEEMTFQPVAERLAHFLADLPVEGGSVQRSLTLDEMAARIGTTREVVCRLLHRFEEEAAIQINRTEFTILDRERLAGYSGKGK